MKTLYDVAKEKMDQSSKKINKKESKKLENILHTHTRELKDTVVEYDGAEKIKTIDYENIKFISLADGGACGYAGELYIITKSDNEVNTYCFDYIYETPIEKFQSLLPWLYPFMDKFNSCFHNEEMFQIHLNGWKHCYLGLGNHLFINDDIYSAFMDDDIALFMAKKQYSKILMCWKSKAGSVLGAEI